ncbi:MAG: amidohydrolase [Synergistaceae bacterium]|jgi:amidohydrolase|nr:amidohydrolase [Synergistaceae bacterium]
MQGNTEYLIHEAVERYRREAENLSRYLHDNPEISSKEFGSSARIASLLEGWGFEVEYPFFGMDTAFRATFENGPGPEIAIMIEYDALPDIGHGCGHNLHGSLAVLAGAALKDLSGLYSGKVRLIGTPAEEADGAKVSMAEGSVFDGMDLAIMMHSMGGVCQPNMDVLSLSAYMVKFTGCSAHAVAAPWHGISALAAARKFIDLIDARRECFTPDIHVNSVFVDGGKAPNIIPEHASLFVEFRAGSEARLEGVEDMISKCARGAALALDCGVKLEKHSGSFADMVRIPELEEEMAEILTDLGARVSPVSPPVGSSDVGNVSYRCPTLQPLISITDEPIALHTRDFADATLEPRAAEAMAIGAEAMVSLVLKIMTDETFRRAVSSGFKRELAVKRRG